MRISCVLACVCLTFAYFDAGADEGTVSVYDILSQHSGSIISSSVTPDITRRELEHQDLCKKVDNTVTSFGFWGLEHYLLQPTTDIDVIQAFQSGIEKLQDNNEDREFLQRLLYEIYKSQDFLLSYFESQDEIHQEIGSDLYYDKLLTVKPDLNDSMVALDVGVHARPGCEACLHTISYSFLYFLYSFCLSSYSNRVDRDLRDKPNSISPYIPSLSELWETVQGVPSIWKDVKISPFTEPSNPKLMELCSSHQSAMTYVLDALHCFNMYQVYAEWKRRYEAVHHLHTALQHVSRIIHHARAIHAILSSYLPEKALEKLPQSALLAQAQDTYPSEHVARLDTLLSSDTFSQDTYLYSWGKVLVTHHIMKNNTDAFIPLLQYIGAADALVGIADLYNDLRSEQNGFCCATFDPSASTPYVHFENFWTPLLPADKAVGNTATLDTQNAIFTGPNGIGKSTNMKGIAHSIIMAQSIGIVPADSAHMSLFNYIGTYLNIREDTQAGLSSFMAEKKRVDEFYKEAPHLTGNVLYLLDEPFRGTYAQEAERRVYEFGQFINQYPNIMMLMATHFEHPVHLQDQHRFINYHVGIDENDDGSFHLTYKLCNGILWWWFYDDDKRARFIDWISDKIIS